MDGIFFGSEKEEREGWMEDAPTPTRTTAARKVPHQELTMSSMPPQREAWMLEPSPEERRQRLEQRRKMEEAKEAERAAVSSSLPSSAFLLSGPVFPMFSE